MAKVIRERPQECVGHCRLLELELRTIPGDESHALRADALDLDGACAVVATIGTTSSTAMSVEFGMRGRGKNQRRSGCCQVAV